MNNKKTGFGGVLPWMNTLYPANGNRIVISTGFYSVTGKRSLDIGPRSQQFLKKIVPNLP